MRAVLDTNVLVSGIFFTGPPFEILRAWRSGRFHLCVSAEIVQEYEVVLRRLRDQFPDVDALDVLAVIVANSQVVAARAFPERVSADPDDDKFLACAVAAKAHFVVSGDRDLLEIGSYGGVRIVRPRRFLEEQIDGSS